MWPFSKKQDLRLSLRRKVDFDKIKKVRVHINLGLFDSKLSTFFLLPTTIFYKLISSIGFIKESNLFSC